MGRKILIVDDEPSASEYLRLLLEQEDFDVRTTGNCVEALIALEGFEPIRKIESSAETHRIGAAVTLAEIEIAAEIERCVGGTTSAKHVEEVNRGRKPHGRPRRVVGHALGVD